MKISRQDGDQILTAAELTVSRRMIFVSETSDQMPTTSHKCPYCGQSADQVVTLSEPLSERASNEVEVLVHPDLCAIIACDTMHTSDAIPQFQIQQVFI